jgi:hypothetical protein
LRRRRVGLSRGEEEERKGEGRGGQAGPACQRLKEKEKRDGGAWAAAGKRMAAVGPLGRKVRRVSFLFFFFFFKLFKSNFSFQIQTKILQTFLQNFINFFRIHTSNQKPCKAK